MNPPAVPPSKSSTIPWGEFEGCVWTVTGDSADCQELFDESQEPDVPRRSRDGPRATAFLPCLKGIAADAIGHARARARLIAAVAASAFGAVVPGGAARAALYTLVAAYACDAPTLLVTDDNGVHAVDPESGAVTTVCDFSYPNALCVDPSDGSVLVGADHAVYRLSLPSSDAGTTASAWAAASCSVVAGRPHACDFVDGSIAASRFRTPSVFACSADGREIVVADGSASRIRVIEPRNFRVHTIAGTGEFESRDGLAIAIAAGQGGGGSSGSAQVIGALASALGGVYDPLHPPDSIEPADVYVVCPSLPLRRVCRRTNTLSSVPLDPALNPAQHSPNGLFGTPSGWLLLSTHWPGVIFAVEPRTGRAIRLAGVRSAADDVGTTDGAALRTASFGLPYGLAGVWPSAPSLSTASAGKPDSPAVWVADNGCHRVRGLTLAPFFAVPPAPSK